MSKLIRNYSVTFKASIFEGLVSSFKAEYPNEKGGFLIGELPEPNVRKHIYEVNDVWVPYKQDGTPSGWGMYHEDLIEAQVYAASVNKIVLGYTHSHPYKSMRVSMTTQSYADAELQSKYRLELSLIVGCTKDGRWAVDVWKDKYSAPLKIYFKNSHSEVFTYPSWRKKSRNRIWRDVE